MLAMAVLMVVEQSPILFGINIHLVILHFGVMKVPA
jgi:hypothetical protein